MEDEKIAIIFVPGFDAITQNYYIEHSCKIPIG